MDATKKEAAEKEFEKKLAKYYKHQIIFQEAVGINFFRIINWCLWINVVVSFLVQICRPFVDELKEVDIQIEPTLFYLYMAILGIYTPHKEYRRWNGIRRNRRGYRLAILWMVTGGIYCGPAWIWRMFIPDFQVPVEVSWIVGNVVLCAAGSSASKMVHVIKGFKEYVDLNRTRIAPFNL